MAEENQQVATTNGVDHSIASSSHSNEQIVQTLLQLQTQTPTPTLAEGSSVNGSSAPSANVEEQQPPPTPVVPQTEWDILRAQLKQKPHDPDGWNRLVGLAESSGDLQKIKETYEGLLEVYPNTASAQIAYVRHFLVPGNLVEGEVIFKRFMLASPPPPDVEFWRYYIEHVRRVNVGPEKRESIRKAYDYALNHIGQDKDSGDTWMSYIMFLRAGETKSPWEEGQKMDALRKVYHRAVQIPLENIEAIWSEYEAFERNLNAITAKKFMADLSPSYMQARGVLRQLQQHLRPLFPPPPPPPTLYLPAKPTFSNAERALVGQWKNYLRWEESNPLEIEEAQRTTLIARIQSVYRKAVIRMRFYGEIWYMAYQWTNSVGKTAEAMNILKAGHEANPTSFVLNFALAESHELAQRFEEVHQLYTRLLEALRVDLEAIDAQVAEEKANEAQQGSQESQPDNTQNSLLSQVSLAAMPKPLDSKKPHDERLRERKREYGVVWINYMRFALRAEGQQAARTVFGKARRDPYTPWQVYQAAALREYHSTREPTVATKIYAKGLELFGSEADFVVHYLSFLLSVNDENNARAVFEQVINNFEPEEARPIWERWARHQYQYGDLASSLSIEQRMAAVYPNDRPIKRFAQRHTFDNIDVIANRDLGLAAARQASAGSSPTQNQGHNQSQPQSQTQGEAKGPTPLARTSTQQSLGNERERAPSRDRGAAGKRAASPDYKRREEAYGNKRARQSSPPPREWRDHGPGSSRRRHNSPGWDHRERSRERERKHKEEEDKVQLPSVLSWFIGSLPPPSSFDGPIFRTDDLMQVFRNAVIPSVTGRARSPPPPPPPPRGNTRPPPDYSPYQGPGGPRGRRY